MVFLEIFLPITWTNLNIFQWYQVYSITAIRLFLRLRGFLVWPLKLWKSICRSQSCRSERNACFWGRIARRHRLSRGRANWENGMLVLFLKVFGHKLHILLDIELGIAARRVCNLVVLVEWTWSHWRVLIFGRDGPQSINFSILCGHALFGHDSAIFFPIGLKFLRVTQETIIYRLVMRNHDFDAFFERNHIFNGKMGAAATLAPMGLGP